MASDAGLTIFCLYRTETFLQMVELLGTILCSRLVSWSQRYCSHWCSPPTTASVQGRFSMLGAGPHSSTSVRALVGRSEASLVLGHRVQTIQYQLDQLSWWGNLDPSRDNARSNSLTGCNFKSSSRIVNAILVNPSLQIFEMWELLRYSYLLSIYALPCVYKTVMSR